MSKRGRPPFRPTPALRKRVSIAAGAGMSHEEIAMALGISRNTLEKHFEHELSVGAHQRRMEVVEALHKAALDGNVSAAKAYTALSPRTAALPAETPIAPVGKKEKANAEAKVAQNGTEWEELLKPSVTPLQ